MPSAREMRLRIRSVKNISQVTSALETVSASKVKRAVQATMNTRPYAEKAWKVLTHLANQPGSATMHPMLNERAKVEKVLVILITSDRGLAGAYNMNIVRQALLAFQEETPSVSFITVGRKGRDLLLRRRKNLIAEFSNLPAAPAFIDISPISRIAIDDFMTGKVDQVYLAYTDFVNMIIQKPIIRKILPIDVEKANPSTASHSVFTYEPDGQELLDLIIRRFTAMQIFEAVLEASASEHAARMVAMRNATENAQDLSVALQLEYNKARQQSITNEMLDISGGAEALAKSIARNI